MRENLFESLTAQAQARRLSRRVGQRFESLNALARAAAIARELKLPRDSFDLLRDEAIACLALPDLKKTGRVIHRPPEVMMTAFDSTMTRYALRFRNGTISIRRVADDTEIARFQAGSDFADSRYFRFSPDGHYLANCNNPVHVVTVWDVDRRAVALKLPDRTLVRFSPDSRRVFVDNDGDRLLVYDLTSGQALPRWHATVAARFCVFRPDGKELAGVYDRTCRILDAETGSLIRSFPLPSVGDQVAWSPDGTTLATWSDDLKIYLWDAATGTRKAVLEGSTNGGV